MLMPDSDPAINHSKRFEDKVERSDYVAPDFRDSRDRKEIPDESDFMSR
jgi:hypothetical protein